MYFYKHVLKDVLGQFQVTQLSDQGRQDVPPFLTSGAFDRRS